eukprot:6173033-Pleurochrysis_carterae.AAC.1
MLQYMPELQSRAISGRKVLVRTCRLWLTGGEEVQRRQRRRDGLLHAAILLMSSYTSRPSSRGLWRGFGVLPLATSSEEHTPTPRALSSDQLARDPASLELQRTLRRQQGIELPRWQKSVATAIATPAAEISVCSSTGSRSDACC